MSINPIATSLNSSKFQKFAKMSSGFEGSPAIKKEADQVNYVRVSNIVFDEEGVTALVTRIPAPGMPGLGRDNRESHEIFAAWEIFGFTDTEWYANYVSWHLLFDPVLVEKVVALAADAAKEGKLIGHRTVLKAYADHERSQRSLPPNP